jgi:hypothetical protein
MLPIVVNVNKSNETLVGMAVEAERKRELEHIHFESKHSIHRQIGKVIFVRCQHFG